MKKYNTPEMKVAKFNVESILTASSDFATFDAFVNDNNLAGNVFEKTWTELQTAGLDITF
ncbi:MAG: hypothetical protein IJC09_05175 [Clostridia bacterium]|nr:hypothetical protein [Clostridia bacterium]